MNQKPTMTPQQVLAAMRAGEPIGSGASALAWFPSVAVHDPKRKGETEREYRQRQREGHEIQRRFNERPVLHGRHVPVFYDE